MEFVENEDLEVKLLLDAIFFKYGYDFRNYSRAHIKRRVQYRMQSEDISSICALMHDLIYDEIFFRRFLLDLSINTTEMFRDIEFYQEVRNKIIPFVNEKNFIRIWHAGCSTGEEVYSMAILLQEYDIYNKVQIYATDFNDTVLDKAKQAIFPITHIKEYTRNYQESGGTHPFSTYYRAKYDSIIMNKGLKKNILFAIHNLVTDGVFNEMDVIFCRNVLIYFNKDLQNRVIGLFYDSLPINGILCLGAKESLQFTAYEGLFEAISKNKIYRKIK